LQQRQPKHSKLAGSGGGRKIRRSIDATSDQVESIMEPNVEKENDGDEDRKAVSNHYLKVNRYYNIYRGR
jgi:hypothetical protein